MEQSFVVACGVRKQWAREFKGMEGPSEQIRRLKQILADLGMTGRMSLEQAKAIRAKRELAQELGEHSPSPLSSLLGGWVDWTGRC